MLMVISPGWDRFFGWSADAASTLPQRSASPFWSPPAAPPQPVRRLYGGYTVGSPVDTLAGAASAGAGNPPPARPRPPVDRRPIPPAPPRSAIELAWLTWQMPAGMQEQAKAALRDALAWRAQHCRPLDAPKPPAQYTRFGLLGEQLTPRAANAVCQTLREEVREFVRMLESCQSRTERNYLLAMHSIRLGQLCAELEQRGLDALKEVRDALTALRARAPSPPGGF